MQTFELETTPPALPLIALIERREPTFVFQPIFEVDGLTVHGYEALCRLPSRLHPAGPIELFRAAHAAGLSSELDLLLVELGIQRFRALGLSGHLFLNVLPQTLVRSDGVARLIRKLIACDQLNSSNIVIEITEHGLNLDPELIEAGTRPLRELGCQIAIDDLGAGASGLKVWSVVRPDFVKLDQYFAKRLGTDQVGLEVLRSVLDIAHVMGSRLVAEGIETPEQCAALQDLGVDYLQGYWLGRPEAEPRQGPSPSAHPPREPTRRDNCAETLLEQRTPLGPEARVEGAVALFQQHPDWHSIAVVASERVVGVVRRDQLLTLLSRPLYPDLFNRKPVERLMDPAPVVVDCRARLEQVSRIVTGSGSTISEDFLISRHGRYAGIGRTVALLQQITALQVEVAAQSNPLTLLPGNREIDAQLDRVLALRVPVVMCHADLDSFKAYNDVYGYRAGDQVLLHFADLLRCNINPSLDFLGHVGGDDFILLLRSPDWRRMLDRVFEAFDASVRTHYSEEHRAKGILPALDRDGRDCAYPLMTLSIGAVATNGTRSIPIAELTERLRRVKSRAKSKPGHALFLDAEGCPEEIYVQPGISAAITSFPARLIP